ncbi:MAG: hypothetical protein ACFFD2_11240 [Promethearchaeota archaeon]
MPLIRMNATWIGCCWMKRACRSIHRTPLPVYHLLHLFPQAVPHFPTNRQWLEISTAETQGTAR